MSRALARLSPDDARSTLAEGPHWWPGHGLLWVDIRAGVLFLHRENGRTARWRLPESVSAGIPTTDGRVVLPGVGRLLVLDVSSGAVDELLRLPQEPEGNRCNDAKCDPFGNLWIGTMDDEEVELRGNLWCLTAQGHVVRTVCDVGVPNTLAWDRRRERMYFADSKRRTVFAFPWRPHAGVPALGEPQVFLAPETAPGAPDGSAITTDGALLNARWDGARVICVGPEGDLRSHVSVPAGRVTSCCLGGADHRTLFVTTAHDPEASPEDLGGHVFALPDSPFAGAPANTFKVPERFHSTIVDLACELSR